MAFIGLLLYIVCIYLRPAEWVPVLYGTSVMQIIGIVTTVLWIFSMPISKKKIVKSPLNIFMIGFLFALIVSHLSHFYFGGALNAFFDFSKVLIMFFLITNVIDSFKKFKITISLMIFLSLLLVIQGIMQYEMGFGWAGQPLEKGRITWIGIFNDPNDLALAFVIIVPFLLNSIFSSPKMRNKIISLPMLGVMLYGIYLTNSRGGMLSLGVVLFSFPLFYLKKKGHMVLGLIIGMFAITLLFAYAPSRMADLSVQEDSAYGRIEAWYEGIQMLKSAPLFGVGYRMFTDYFHYTAHNSIILCAAEAGLLGLFFWIGLFYFSFRSLKLIQENESSVEMKNIGQYAYLLQIGMIGFLVSSMFLSRTYILLPYLLMALSASLYNIRWKVYNNLKNNEIRATDLKNIAFISVASLIFVYFVMKVTI